VLHDVSLSIPQYAITALIGPSGCGKSTFLKCLNRLIDEDDATVSGSILLDGQEILSPAVDLPALRCRVGMVFQTPTPFPMSIFDNVAYGIRLHGRLPRRELSRRVEDALRKAALFDDIADRLRAPASCLSGGQQQRLCIARTLATEPEVLLLDEPTSALDPVSTAQIERLLLALRDRLTIVIVTHNLPQARRIADRCAFFCSGEIAQSGSAQLLTGRGACPALRRYLETE
jgi:phosphate transport system ATP-binding protein